MMDKIFLASTLDFIGKICLALVALMVHYKVEKEKKIDKHIVKQMKLETALGIFSIILFVIAYVLLI